MKLIINTSNISIGGGLQVALSVLHELKKFNDNKYYVFLSRNLNKQIKASEYPDNFIFYKIDLSINDFFKRIKTLNALEKTIKPDAVFTVFGPTYWRPKSIHITGFAIGWAINPDSIAFTVLSVKQKIQKKIQNFIKLKCATIESSFFFVETETVKKRLSKFGGVPLNNIYIVGNTYNNHFLTSQDEKKKILPEREKKDEFRFISISANYPHKNLAILNDVIPILKNKKLNVRFYLTIRHEEFKSNFIQNSDYITNLGPVDVSTCPYLYKETDALFLPTLLESFSASYPEAMISKRPILTSNLDFAREICNDAALYFNPLSPMDIAKKIEVIISNPKLSEKLIGLGNKRLLDFPKPNERVEKYLKTLSKLTKIK